MKHYNILLRQHQEIDANLARELAIAVQRNHTKKAERLNEKRDINDKAYFLLLFAQFEDFINKKCTHLIDRKLQLNSWEVKRAYEILGSVRRIKFMNRVALLTRKGGRHYNIIFDYYKSRNELSHGRLLSTSITFLHIANDLARIARLL